MKFWQSDAFLGPIMVLAAPFIGVLWGFAYWLVVVRHSPELIVAVLESFRKRRNECQQ